MPFITEVMKKVPKDEVLRFYRISDFDDITELAESVAKKKGFMKKIKIESKKKKPDGTPKYIEKTSPDDVMGAKRILRDFLNNRLTYYSEV
jgi:hypothetical protein